MNTINNKNLNKHFYSFEGIDFSGKTTQIKMLQAWLENRGNTVHILREPGGTEISEKVRAILLDKEHMHLHARAELLLYSAARVQLMIEKIIPLLEKGHYIIADRFVDSTTAYQGFGRGLEQEIVEQVNQFATLGLLPSITFYVKLNPEEALKRRLKSGQEADRLESSGMEFFNKVSKGYEIIAKKDYKRFQIIDGSQVMEEIHRQIIEIVMHK